MLGAESISNAEKALMPTMSTRARNVDAPWKRIQQNTFTRWANQHIKQAKENITDLETDLSDGLKLIALLEVLAEKRIHTRYNKKPKIRSQKLENVSLALEFLEREGIVLINIDSADIVDCKIKLILGMIWKLILHYSISISLESLPSTPGVEDQDQKTPKQRLNDPSLTPTNPHMI